jgi:predicted TIM-barrel fold metal-dependent hydrolase
LNRYDPLDPRALAFLDELTSWKTPPAIWLDSLIYPRGVPLAMPIAQTMRHLAERYGNLTFVCLHAGGALALELFDAVRACPNVYLDLSYSLVCYARSSVALDHRFLLERFDRRTLFGSDFPEVALPEATARFEALAEGLEAAKAENVRSRTLAQLLDRVLVAQG